MQSDIKTGERWLFLPIETKVRELESKLLLSLFALKKGYTVVLGQHYVLSQYLKYFPPGIFLYKDLSFYKKAFFESIKQCNHKIVSLDEEAIFAFDDPMRYSNERFSEENLHLVEKVICWGRFDYEAMFPKYQEYKDKFARLGNPRLDVWSTRLNDIYNVEAIQLRERYGKFILIPSNFAYQSNVNGPDFVLQFFEGKNIIKNKEDRNRFIEKWDFMNWGWSVFQNLIPRLAQEYKELNFVVRNHPSEDPKVWNELARKHDNVFVEFKGSISPYIKAAQCILHFGCTSGLEAFLSKTPSFIFCPESNDKFEQSASAKLSYVFQNYSDLTSAINNVLRSEIKSDCTAETYFRDNFSFDDSVFSADRIMQMIEHDIHIPPSIDTADCRSIERSITIKKVKGQIKNHKLVTPFRIIFNHVMQKTGYQDPLATSIAGGKQKWPGMSEDEIATIIGSMSKLINMDLDFECEDICNELFILRNIT